MPQKKRKNKRVQRKRFNINEEYEKAWKYIKESKSFIYFIIGVFLFFFLLGFFIPPPDFIYNEIVSFLKSLLNETQNLSQGGLITYIIFNNIESTLYGVILGTAFGILPLLSTVVNGYMLGFVSSVSVATSGLSSLWKIFPHGIFEIPAVFISLGLGFKTGTFIFQKKKMEFLKDSFWNSIRVFLLVVVPLLIVAGIIEGTLIFLLK